MRDEKKTAVLRAPSDPPADAADFYIENGYIVFTREYHLKRGFCCKSGCRHCPWDFGKTAEPAGPA